MYIIPLRRAVVCVGARSGTEWDCRLPRLWTNAETCAGSYSGRGSMRLAASSFSAASGAMALVAALIGEPGIAMCFLTLGWFFMGLRMWAGKLERAK